MSATLAKASVPSSMVDALEADDPYEALLALAKASEQTAQKLASNLSEELERTKPLEIPVAFSAQLSKAEAGNSSSMATARACADSILESLSKIASGGSQASQEIQSLETEKRELEDHARDIETALRLRRAADRAGPAVSAQKWSVAAQTLSEDYLSILSASADTDRAKAYAGDYTLAQLESTSSSLRTQLMQEYQSAVEASDLQQLGTLTPLVEKVQLEDEAVGLYLKFLEGLLTQELKAIAETSESENATKNAPKNPFSNMAKIYNTGVKMLRHHLPLVAHCLHRAKGDVAVVQLVHARVEKAVEPLFQDYIRDRQLSVCAGHAQRIYAVLEERYSSSSSAFGFLEGGDDDDDGTGDSPDDAGFQARIGTLSDVDRAMEEAALCIQYAESYWRFLQHTVGQVDKARAIRHQQEQERKRLERERREWAAQAGGRSGDSEDAQFGEDQYAPVKVLASPTQLQQDVAEIGGYYSAIEKCLLLASMQRAFGMSPDDMRQFSRLGGVSGGKSAGPGSQALQTSLVESCLYAARRAVQRAFATGHTGTASAVANNCADCLRGVLADYLRRRAEDLGVSPLKPGEGLLLEGSAGMFVHALMRQGQTGVSQAVGVAAPKSTSDHRQERALGIARACATLNDLEVAAHHTRELEDLLQKAVEQGYPANTHDTEQLTMCVKSFSPVADVFGQASSETIESLITVLKPRIRAIVGDAVGHEGSSAAAGFTSVMGGAKSSDRAHVRMNYNLDEEAYQLLEISERYIARICSHLDEIILPLSAHLSPKLSDELVLGVLGATAKRLEVSLKKCHFTSLGALSLDSDMRDLLNYAKDRLDAPELNSNMALFRACVPLARLLQISKLMNVDDLEDVLDLISASKRKKNWDLRLEDAKSYLCLRVEFEDAKVHDLLQMPDED